MSHEVDPRETTLDEVTSSLAQGLSNCKKLVDGYRAALSNPPRPANDDPAPETDQLSREQSL